MTPRHGRSADISSVQIRSAMVGHSDDHLRVVRQAYRIRDNDTDELSLICVDDVAWWVAQRLSDQLTVWVYIGDDEASDAFERHITGVDWVEAGTR